jgi:hypothetical protein
MATRDIRTFHDTEACDLCGRTLLRGEHAQTWLAGPNRRAVCELCTGRAINEGWVREGARLETETRALSHDRRPSLLDRLRQRRDRARAEEPEPVIPAPNTPPAASHPPPPTAVIPREPRQVNAVPTDPAHRVHAAIDVFNASEEIRTVAGVERSLGPPAVSVRAMPGTTRVAIAVSWELSWYRFEVELADDKPGVTRTGQGYELGELESDERVPNAATDEYGRLALS